MKYLSNSLEYILKLFLELCKALQFFPFDILLQVCIRIHIEDVTHSAS